MSTRCRPVQRAAISVLVPRIHLAAAEAQVCGQLLPLAKSRV